MFSPHQNLSNRNNDFLELYASFDMFTSPVILYYTPLQKSRLILQAVLHILRVKSRHGESSGKLVHSLPQGGNLLVSIQTLNELNQLRSTLLLNLQRNLQRLVQEHGYLFKVGLDHFTCCQRRSADTHASRSDRRSIPGDAILVQSDGHGIARLFELGSGDLLGFQIPKNEVIFGTTGGKGVSQTDKLGTQGGGVGLHLFGVGVKFGSHNLKELGGHARDLMFVGSSLKGGENGLVDLVFESALVLAEEDHARAGSAEGFVGGGGDDVAELEGGGLLLGGHESGDVGHVHEKEGAVVVGDFAEFSVVPIAGVGGSTADDHGGFEEGGVAGELIVVDEAGGGVDLVGEGFEVDRGGADGLARALLLGVGVESVRQVSARGEVKSHDTVVRAEECGVHGKVGGRSGVGLDVDAPFLGIQAVCLEGTLLAELLDLIHDFITSVVSGVGKALGVFVGEGRSEAIHYSF
mmetsp:Transcript_12950/g.27501  ORF Transcript_12950/g.27501 Transcript_12950/m.27501 type:complete len:464 (+) Transcript_12950:200-1591(+)